MEAPQHICEQIYQIDPDIRLGWTGLKQKPDEPRKLNHGRFALILLINPRLEQQVLTGTPWLDRGPIFGCWFDPLQRIPMVIGWYKPGTPWDEVIWAVKDRKKPIVPVIESALLNEGKWYDDQVNDLAGEMGEHLYWQASQTGHSGVEATPQKSLSQRDRDILAGTDESQQPLTDAFANEIPK